MLLVIVIVMKYCCLRKIARYKTKIFLSALVIFTMWLAVFCQFRVELNDLTTTLPYKSRVKPGHLGNQVGIPTDLPNEILVAMEENNQLFGFHQYRSDLIGYHRTLPDHRDEWCKVPYRFLKDLPSTSIIIPIYHEAWSAIIRTVNSIIKNSPPKLIHEIILVVDQSDLAHLKTLLEDQFINHPFFDGFTEPQNSTSSDSNVKVVHNAKVVSKVKVVPKVKVVSKLKEVPKVKVAPKIKIIRTKKREGLIRAKNLGAQHATGEVLTFMDSHCECTEGWLEPLLDRIARNSTTLTLAIYDLILNDTFEYQSEDPTSIGFTWGLAFNPIFMPEREVLRSHGAEPFYSPVMMGSLFSISRAFFEKLGAYDSGLELWGGENLEISFKAWMCGGCVEVVPCSRVGHVFRSRDLPYHTTSETLLRNLARIAEVWMDEYLDYFYERRKRIGLSDLSSQKALRKHLKCKSFDWYLKNVYPELHIPKDCPSYGEIRNEMKDGNKVENIRRSEEVDVLCLDSLGRSGQLVALEPCHGLFGNQDWLLTKTGEIRMNDDCLDYTGTGLYLYKCHGMKGNQYWKYSMATKLFIHAHSYLCIAVGEDRTVPVMKTCDVHDEGQMWILPNYNPRNEV